MLIIGIDPGISGSICFLKDGKILDVIEMPTMAEGKKNKRQVNGHQMFNELSFRIKKYNLSQLKFLRVELIVPRIEEIKKKILNIYD